MCGYSLVHQESYINWLSLPSFDMPCNTCNRPVNLCSDLFPYPNPNPLFNLVMVSWTPLASYRPPSPRSCCALCQKNRKESRLRDETRPVETEGEFHFLPPKTRVSSNWKMFISRCSTFAQCIAAYGTLIGAATAYGILCKLCNLLRTASEPLPSLATGLSVISRGFSPWMGSLGSARATSIYNW